MKKKVSMCEKMVGVDVKKWFVCVCECVFVCVFVCVCECVCVCVRASARARV